MYRTNSKHIQQLIINHILSFTDDETTIETLLNNHIASGYNSPQYGDYLVYYWQQREFLETLDLKIMNNQFFTSQKIHKLYVKLLNRELEKMINNK
jgi:hypothetical protein